MGRIKEVLLPIRTALQHLAKGEDTEKENDGDYVNLINDSDPTLSKILEDAWSSVESDVKSVEIPDKPKNTKNTRASINDVKVTGTKIEVKVRKPSKAREEQEREDGPYRQ